MLKEAVSSICGAAQAVGGQIGGEVEEGGEALIPATERRKMLFTPKEKQVRGNERERRRRTSADTRRGSWARP